MRVILTDPATPGRGSRETSRSWAGPPRGVRRPKRREAPRGADGGALVFPNRVPCIGVMKEVMVGDTVVCRGVLEALKLFLELGESLPRELGELRDDLIGSGA